MRPALFLQVMSIEARRQMSYRIDFWLGALMGFVGPFGLAWFLWRAMYDAVPGDDIGGFTFRAMILYYVVVVLLQKVVRGGGFDVMRDIYEGGLNRYIVFPTSYLPFKYAQHLGGLLPAVVQLVLFTALFAALMRLPPDVTIDAGSVLACAITVTLANLLYFLMMFPLECVAFWADNVWSLLVALRMATGLLGGALVPLTLFPGWAQDLLGWTPLPLLFHVPAEVLLGRMAPDVWLGHLAVGSVWLLALLAAGGLVWRRGQYRYTGIGI